MYNEGKRDYLYLLNQEIYSRNKSTGTNILNRSFLYVRETPLKTVCKKKTNLIYTAI